MIHLCLEGQEAVFETCGWIEVLQSRIEHGLDGRCQVGQLVSCTISAVEVKVRSVEVAVWLDGWGEAENRLLVEHSEAADEATLAVPLSALHIAHLFLSSGLPCFTLPRLQCLGRSILLIESPKADWTSATQ